MARSSPLGGRDASRTQRPWSTKQNARGWHGPWRLPAVLSTTSWARPERNLGV